jgi:hypothetical protein
MTTKKKIDPTSPYAQCEAAAKTTLAVFKTGRPNAALYGDREEQLALLLRLRELVQEACETGSSLSIVTMWLAKSLEIFETGFESEYGPADEHEADPLADAAA